MKVFPCSTKWCALPKSSVICWIDCGRHADPEEAAMAVNKRDKFFLVRNASAVVYVSHRLAVHVM